MQALMRYSQKEKQMKRYKLTYARVVILETVFEARDKYDASQKAIEMEVNGKLGIESVEVTSDDNWVRDIQDYEEVWEIEPA